MRREEDETTKEKKLDERGREFTRIVCGYIRTTKKPTALTQTLPQI